MQIENIKAQAREEIAKLMPLADAATRESAVAVYLAGALYDAEERAWEPYENPTYQLLTAELRNLMHARVANAG